MADFRGKTVLVCFWTTSHGGCLDELEDFLDLEKKHADDLAIIGVSMDDVKDDDGGIGDDDDLTILHRQGKCNLPTDKEIREKVANTVKGRDWIIRSSSTTNILFSGRYNASTVPTTLIIDKNSLIRRRFYGRRSLPVLAAMLEELRQPTNAVAQTNRSFASSDR